MKEWQAKTGNPFISTARIICNDYLMIKGNTYV
jgi:hypothetical protein